MIDEVLERKGAGEKDYNFLREFLIVFMSNEEVLSCSFARKKNETELLIAGLDAHICTCIEQAFRISMDDKEEVFRGKVLILMS